MKKKEWARAVLVGFIGIIFVSCATKYHRVGLTGGYSEMQIDSNTLLVNFNGNGYTPRQTAETYALYRCAELTSESGNDYFVIVGGNVDNNAYQYMTPGRYNSTTSGNVSVYGNQAYGRSSTMGTYTPGQVVNVNRYAASLKIRLYKGEKPEDDPDAYNAQEVLTYMANNIIR